MVDRTALILDIFAQHATSREGKAQVELAQMQYMLPRLRGWGESLSRQAGGRVAGGGGIGTRGPGETKIETDRRRIRVAGEQAAPRDRRHGDGPDDPAVQPRPQRRAQRRDRRLHERRQVQPAQPAHRRRRAGARTRCSPPWTRRSAGPSRPTAASTRSPTPSASCGTCRTSWSTPSAPRSRRWPPPTCCCTSSTAPTPIRSARSRPCASCCGEIDAAAVPEVIVVNKVDAMTEDDVLTLRQALPGRGVGVGPHRRRHRRAARAHRRAAAAPRRRRRRAGALRPG